MKRQCHCSGSCVPPASGLNRRDFLTRSAAGAAALLSTSAWWPTRLSAAELDQWLKSVAAPGPGRVFRHDVHTDARLHLGGIGTGNFEIGPDGRLTTWQLFNTLRDGEVPFHFAAKVGDTARLLQTSGGPDVPKVGGITMTGDYPFATLRYMEPAFPEMAKGSVPHIGTCAFPIHRSRGGQNDGRLSGSPPSANVAPIRVCV